MQFNSRIQYEDKHRSKLTMQINVKIKMRLFYSEFTSLSENDSVKSSRYLCPPSKMRTVYANKNRQYPEETSFLKNIRKNERVQHDDG